jgi:polyhydroxyalkanoate synthase
MSNPYSDLFERQQQAWTGAAEMVETLGSIPEANEEVANVEVGQTPSETVYEENKLELHHYEPRTEEQHDVPLLIVYALVNRPYILDLQPDRSVVRTFLDNGFDVYMIDWGEPSLLDHSLGFGDYVDRYLDNCVDVVRERSGRDDINVLGYCMGGTMSTMYAALYPEKVRNLGLMAAALCFNEDGGIFGRWVGDDTIDVELLAETFGTVPSELIDAGFGMGEPVANNLTKYLRFFDNLDDEDFVRNFARMERWLDESIDVAGNAFVDFVTDTYREQKLYNNEQYVAGKHADVENLDMPIAQVVATYDHIVPPVASTAFNDVVPSDDVTVFEQKSGHIGLSVSSRALEELWPNVCDWFAERSQVDEGDEPGDAGRDDDETPARPESTADLETVDGIGPTYAERLRDAGVDDVGALADVDPATVAADADVPVARLEAWVAQARERTT